MPANWIKTLSAFLVAFSVQTVSAQTNNQSGRFIIKENGDYYGFDLQTLKEVTQEECQNACLANTGCKAFTYNTSAQFCFLKSDFGDIKFFDGAIAGRLNDAHAEQDLGKAPNLEFISNRIRKSASALRAEIVNSESFVNAEGFYRHLANASDSVNQSDYYSAIFSLNAALKIDPDHLDSWLRLSEAARLLPTENRRDKKKHRDMAVSAGFYAYVLSRTKEDRAAALSALGWALEETKNFRSAITSHQKSYDLVASNSKKLDLLELRKKYGFRIVDHTIDADSANPRICAQFSEKLQTKFTGYGDFISLNNAPVKAIDVKNKQICIEGLKHGEEYKVTFREGLPSAVHEDLPSNIDLEIYVKDRASAVRFTGNNFVLPSKLRKAIPLVSINANKADLNLHRIGERSFAPLIRNSQFLTRLGEYTAEYLVDEIGEPVWSGSLDIASELNKEIVTAIPVEEALKDRKPGVYLLTAKPGNTKPDNYNALATQWFIVSDIGLTTFSGDKKLSVFTRSLDNAKPLANLEVTLIARNNQVLGTANTDDGGQVSFDAGLLRGKGSLAPAVITAKSSEQDFVFLDLTQPGFDFSDRGVTGREPPKGVDVYTWSERGIYRAGETVHISALARDASAKAVSDLPLTFIFTRPDGVEDRRFVDDGADLGGYHVELSLTDNAKRGTWLMQVYTDPKSTPVAQHRFLVEDFLPEKTDFSMKSDEAVLQIGEAIKVDVDGRYLYGAPAAGLSLEGEVIVKTKRERKEFPGYLFGLASSDEGSTQRVALKDLPKLDEDGKGTFEVLVNKSSSTTRMQEANIVVRMRENNGRSIERRMNLDVKPTNTMIGVKSLFKDGQVSENANADFEVIGVDQNGKRIGLSSVRWSLVRIERNYQWYRDNSYWRYEAIDVESEIASGNVNLEEQELAKISMPVDWGKYRLDLETDAVDGPATSIEFRAGWYVEAKSTQTPDGLEMALDKESYKAGEVAKLSVSPRYAGELLLAVATDHIVDYRTITVPAEGATIDIPVEADWGAGAYMLATLYRSTDAGNSRMPARAIGVKWLSVDPQDRDLKIVLDTPEKIQPNETLKIPLSVENFKEGETTFVNVAVVDIGILNLTRYESPNPVKRYFGQRKLGIAMRDIYGQLIDGSQGVLGTLRTGGDGLDELSSSGEPPTEKLVAFFSGPVKLDSEGKANVEFDLPQFNGTVRVMATAWNGQGVGATEKEILVRDPVVVTASLPQFMAPGDKSRMLLEIMNTDAANGQFEVQYDFSDNLTVDLDLLDDRIELEQGKAKLMAIPVEAGSAGKSWARVELSNEDGLFVSQVINMDIRSGFQPETTKTKARLVANTGSLNIDTELLQGKLLEGAEVNISIALENTIEIQSVMARLNRYPYGCAEQITSKALPLLYLSEFSKNASTGGDQDVKKRVQKGIDKVLSYQSSSGGFSLWGSSSDDMWLTAYVTDFLTRATEQGYQVPRQSLRQALQNIKNTLAYRNNLDDNDEAIAYSLYVLARNKMASAGDIRYYVDTQLSAFRSPIARAQLAAGAALYGDQQRSKATFASAFELALEGERSVRTSYSYGSPLRDAAAILALAGESKLAEGTLADMNRLVSSLDFSDKYQSTQEQAWLLLAAREASKANQNLSLEVDGLPHEGDYNVAIDGEEFRHKPLRLKNRMDQDLQVIITTRATPESAPPPNSQGFTIERNYYDLNGEQVNVSDVKQNQRFVVVLDVQQNDDQESRILISDLLPAGFEIDNPNIIKSATLDNFDWLKSTTPAHVEFRKDRFIGAINRTRGSDDRFTLAYMVRAVSPGTYLHPAASVEDMYRPHLSARTATGFMKVSSSQ